MSSSIQFALNGELVTVTDPDPSVTLNDYIRHQTRYTGTKLGCGEGGCGACAVMVSFVDPASGEDVHTSANSCLRPLVACDGFAITTTEGLGSTAAGFHDVQARIADFNGSQCGFCTPGMVMATYAALVRVSEETKVKEGDPHSLALMMEEAFDGNICRCTGYRPILEAARSLVDDTVTDQVGQGCTTDAHKPAATGKVAAEPPKIPQELRGSSDAKVFRGPTLQWHRTTSLAQALALRDEHGDAARFVAANTSVGIYKAQPQTVLVDVSQIPELRAISQGESSLVVGGAVSITKLISALRQRGERFPAGSRQRASSDALIRHCDRIANHHVRGVGTVAGNLVMTAKHGFESDLATILCGYGASVHVHLADGSSATMPLLQFTQLPDASTKQPLLQYVEIPDQSESTIFRSFKVGLRQLNSHALVNAAMRADVGADGALSNTSIVYGAVNENHPIAVPEVEGLLQGKLEPEVIEKAKAAVVSAARVRAESHRAVYRQHLVSVFLNKFLEIVQANGKGSADISPVEMRFDADQIESRDLVQTRRALVAISDKNTFGKNGSRHYQDVNYSAEIQAKNYPVHAPVPKTSARLQAAGEARYTDDEPMPGDCAFAAFGTSTMGCGKLVSVHTEAAAAAPGVIRIITSKDLPGQNNIGGFWEEPLLAADEVMYAGQPIAIVLADTLRHAQEAAKLVAGEYEQTEPPVITNEQAAAKQKFYPGMTHHHTRTSGKSIDEAIAAAPLKLENIKLKCKSQQHFYMEPHCAWAIPDEGGRMRIGAATQWPNGAHQAVSKVLGIPRNYVKLTNRRSGGGFGGKLTRYVPTLAAAAVAAHLTSRAVRMTLPRNVDMMTTGGRHETDINASVGFDEEGNLLAVKIGGQMSAGAARDASDFVVMSIANASDQVYYVPDWDLKVDGTHTNLSIKTAMRGPGEIQASYVMESIIQAVAHELWERKGATEPLSTLCHRIRMQNTYPADDEEKLVTPGGAKIEHFTMPQLWQKCVKNSDFDKRAAAVEAFNVAHKHRKRGFAMTPVKYGVAARFQQAYITVYEDGSVLLNHGGSEIGQGINTKCIQAATLALKQLSVTGITMSLFGVEDTNTSIIPNASMTGGSTTSEAACAAIMEGMEQLCQRLEPVRAAIVKAKIAKIQKEREEAAAKQSGKDSAIAGGADGASKDNVGAASEEKKTAGEDEVDVPAISWQEVVSRAIQENIPLAIQSCFRRQPGGISSPPDVKDLKYFNFGACASEVEVDVRTGEVLILRSDLVYDCGTSLNPAIDIGQAEGGFVQGLGFYLTEDLLHDEQGRVSSDGTWEYKPPLMSDIPLQLNVEFVRGLDKGKGILSSKASGEPPLILATSVYAAITNAVASARKDAGLSARTTYTTPLTVEQIALACKQ